LQARPVPFALRDKVEAELERLQREGIIEPVQSAEWAAPIVPVVKRDSSAHICGDYCMTINQASRLDSYPLPKVDKPFATLAGGTVFFKVRPPTCIPATSTGEKFPTFIEVFSNTTDCHL